MTEESISSLSMPLIDTQLSLGDYVCQTVNG